MSQLEVDKVIPQSGTTLTLGESGDTITIASGATFTPTLTAPIIDEINDNNGNEEIIFTTTASAVNELTIANAATGNAPEIAATGDDTDIDLKLTPKGAGNLVLDGIEFPNADGSASQVLQTNGSGVLSFATPAAGITEADQWRLTTNVTSDTDPIVNWERNDNAAFGKIGTGMSESSGIFSFPSTGVYSVKLTAQVEATGGGYAPQIDLEVTQNNSTYVNNSYNSQYAQTGDNGSSIVVGSYVNVTDISNVKIKYTCNAFSLGGIIRGNTSSNRTWVDFIRLGDSV
jgi:hypothetical protein